MGPEILLAIQIAELIIEYGPTAVEDVRRLALALGNLFSKDGSPITQEQFAEAHRALAEAHEGLQRAAKEKIGA